jgi:poly-gamma-glutamate synthesis protein (capsule biosynthesis protein)
MVTFLKKFRLILLALFCALVLGACAGQAAQSSPTPTAAVTPEPTPTPTPVTTATLLLAGDVMSHMPQTADALACGGGDSYDYAPCMQYVKPWITGADFAVCNLETVFRQGRKYSGYPAFNSPVSLGEALKDAGFDLVTTANNHCMDQGFTGLCDTLAALDGMGLAHVGTYRAREEFDKNMGVVTADVGGITVAFLDYTYGTNGIPVSDERPFSVNLFNTDYLTDLSMPDTEKLGRELDYAKSLEPDVIAVLLHWGNEYHTRENSYQDQLADFLIENGADLVLGGHPHVLEPLEERTVTASDGNQRTGFVCFSLGNFVSAQTKELTDTTALLRLELEKDWGTGVTVLKNVSYVPCLVLNRSEGSTPRFLILDAYRAMEEYEAGTNEYLSPDTYQRLQKAVEDCGDILGAQYDYTGQ